MEIKASAGVELGHMMVETSLCADCDLPDLAIIPDAACDPRLQTQPAVAGPPHVRFYARARLRDIEGRETGTLCVLGGEPRPEAGRREEKLLAGLAAIASHLLENPAAAPPGTEQQYRSMIESSPDAICVHAGGRVVYVNAAMIRMLGAGSSDDLVGRDVSELVRPFHDDPAGHHVESPRSASPAEARLIRLDGKAVDIETTAFRVIHEGVPATQVVARDVTERRRARQQLLRFESIVQGTTDAIISYLLDGTIASWNPGAERLYGYTAAEMIGKPYSALLTETQWDKLNELATSGDGFGVARELTRRRKDGVEVSVSLSASLDRDASGRPFGVSTIARDMTQAKKRENEIRIMNRYLHQLSGQLLRSQDEERRRIARELHDSIAQTLAAISMNLSLARNQSTAADAGLREMIDETQGLAEQCSQELRAISYLLHPPLLDELGLISALRLFLDGFTRRTKIAVNLDAVPDLGRLSSAIEMTIFRIVQEGLVNVHRHSGSKTASVRLRTNAGGIQLTMTDSGKGMPPDILSQGGGGLFGVGILGMRERAMQLGGRLDIESSGEGTLISVFLPWSQEA